MKIITIIIMIIMSKAFPRGGRKQRALGVQRRATHDCLYGDLKRLAVPWLVLEFPQSLPQEETRRAMGHGAGVWV